LLSGDLWRRSAAHANRMARLLGSELEKVPGIKLTQPVEANGVFAVVPKQFIEPLQKKYFFYTWNEAISEVRLMCSFDTTEEDVQEFVALVRRTVR
jgi:threonine aldolase